MLDNERHKLLTQIVNDPSSTPEERAEARRELAGALDDDALLGLGRADTQAAIAPSSNAARAPVPSPQTAEPVSRAPATVETKPEAPIEQKASHAPSPSLARLHEILAGAPASAQELSSFLEPATKAALGLDYVEQETLRRRCDEAATKLRANQSQEQALDCMLAPLRFGNRTFQLDSSLRREIAGIRLRGILAIRSCSKHRKERCKCFWEGARLELLAFRDRYSPDSDEWKVADVVWDELEGIARTHQPSRTSRNRPPGPDPHGSWGAAAGSQSEHTRPAWLGRRRS